MMLNPAAVEIARRVLQQCFPGIEPAGRWRWQGPLQNGACVPLTARVEENFLRLSAPAVMAMADMAGLERALRANRVLPGGVRFALSPSSRGLHLGADVALGDEARLLAGVRGVMDGFHTAAERLATPSEQDESPPAGENSARLPLRDLLAETSWPFTERSAGEYSVEVQPGFGHAVRITAGRQVVELNLELVRGEPADDAVPQALTVFLLTTADSLRIIRPYRQDIAEHPAFGFQASLPAFAAEEIDRALEGLAAAQYRCLREANVLLDRGVAQRYLALRAVQWLQAPTFKYEEEE